MSWDSMAEGIPEYATTDEGTNSSSPENDSSESPGEETLNVNELETWWMLSGEGRRGKHAQRGLDYELWSDRDTESLSSIVSTLPDNEETYETVKLFMKSFGSVAKNNLARYEGTPPHILAVLAEDQSVKTRQAVAAWQNNLTHKIMSILAHDTNGTVRRALADNPVIPADILETLHGTRFLSDDKSKRVESDAEYIEKNIARNPNCPPNLFQHYLDSGSVYVLSGAVANPNISPAELEEVLDRHTGSNIIVQQAMCNEKMTGEMVDKCVGKLVRVREQRIRGKRKRIVKSWSEENALRALLDEPYSHRGGNTPRASAETVENVYRLYRSKAITDQSDVALMLRGLIAHPHTSTSILKDMVMLCERDNFQGILSFFYVDTTIYAAREEIARRGG